MRKVLVVLAFVLAVVMTAGCDMFRKMAGRPTSEDIDVKRELIVAAEAARQASEDSVRLAKQRTADSLAVLDSMLNSGIPIKTSNQVSPDAKAKMAHRYYVILGAFGNADNAARLQKKVTDAGFESELVPYRNGITAVGVCPSDDLVSMYGPLMELRKQSFCPKEAWIFDKE